MDEKWRAIGATVGGDQHLRMDKPNQDALKIFPEVGEGLPMILAVSDGLGSEKCFNSQIGAVFAVGLAVRVIREFLDSQPKEASLSFLKSELEERVLKTLVRDWEKFVIEHWNYMGQALTFEGLETSLARSTIVRNPVSAYGATLLTVLVTKSFIFYLQLGDGDILTISQDGTISRPIPKDERLFANQTTALSSSKAWREFHYYFQTITTEPPALILVSTDGYANSFPDDEGFYQAAQDIYTIIRSEGLEHVNRNLTSWLNETSQQGSGDDITLGLICNMNIMV